MNNALTTDLFSQPIQTRPSPSIAIDGLTYYPDFITQKEELDLLATINQQIWIGDLKRRVQHYGWRYDYKARSLNPELYLGPLPHWAESLASRLHSYGLVDELPDQVIVNEYKPGQGIANHVDCEPCFGKTIISISLSAISVMSFINIKSREKTDVVLNRRSAVCITGEARYKWSHGIPSRLADEIYGVRVNRELRISITFRKVII